MPEPVEWRPVVGWETLYEVSEFGDVRRIGGTTCLPPRLMSYYSRLSVTLCHKSLNRRFNIHKLVAQAFLGPPPPGGDGVEAIEINHIDGNWWNNHYTNLEYVTRLQNRTHAMALGLLRRGEGVHSAKLTEDKVRAIRAIRAPIWMIAEIFGIGRTTVVEIRQKRAWKHVV